MNYEFHVGDYVLTKNNREGWIQSVHHTQGEGTRLHIYFNDGKWFGYDIEKPEVAADFVYIGEHRFADKEKTRIDPIKGIDYQFDNVALYGGDINMMFKKKINELVDAVNKLRDKENKE